jgi:MFS family permease
MAADTDPPRPPSPSHQSPGIDLSLTDPTGTTAIAPPPTMTLVPIEKQPSQLTTFPTTDSTASYGARPAAFPSTLREALFVVSCTLAVGMSSIFGGSILTITASIGHDLSLTDAQLTWLWAANNLASGAFLLLFGRVADLFGRRWMLVGSLGVYSAVMLVAGFADNAIYIDCMSGLSGLCGAAAVPPAIGKLGAVYAQPSWRKNRAFACFSAGYPVGFVLGAFIAGVATQVASWRVSFWTMSVLFACFTVVAAWTVPGDSEQQVSVGWGTWREFDLLGAALTVVGIGMFTASFTLTGDSPKGWGEDYVIALMVLGLVCIGGFVWWQSVCKTPLMPLRVFRDKNFSILITILSLGNMSFSGNLFWITLMWQRIERQSPLMVAVRLLPAGIGGICVNMTAGLIMHRVSNKRKFTLRYASLSRLTAAVLMIIASASMVTASAIWSATSPGLTYWELSFVSQLLSVIGVDFMFTVTNMYVMSSLPPAQQSIAGGMFNTVTRLISAVGIAIQTAVYNGAGGTSEGPDSLRYRPYQATVWVTLAATCFGLCLSPWLTLGTQGHRKKAS